MTVYKRDKFDSLLKETRQGTVASVYLVIGERYLCHDAVEKLEAALLAENGTLHAIDGDEENFNTTLGQLKSFSLLPGRQVFRVMDSRLFHSKNMAKKLWRQAQKYHDQNKQDKASRYIKDMLSAAGLENTEISEIGSLSASRWKTVFGFAKPTGDLSWLQKITLTTIESVQQLKSGQPGDPALEFEKTLSDGIPAVNTLILVSETVDKRKRLYKYIKENGVVLDLSVVAGSSSVARREQKQVLAALVRQTLDEFGTTLAPGVLDSLLERVGFHPVAVVRETEKLALYTSGMATISRGDLDAVVGRTRQEAVFELTDSLGKGNFERALVVASRLHEHGIHDLAVISVVRKYVRTLLLFRALQEKEGVGYRRGINAGVFQKQCLPALKKNDSWKDELSGHPYAVYMQFKTAEQFSISILRSWLQLLLIAEYRLKGSPVAPGIIIDHLFLSMQAESTKPATISG